MLSIVYFATLATRSKPSDLWGLGLYTMGSLPDVEHGTFVVCLPRLTLRAVLGKTNSERLLVKML